MLRRCCTAGCVKSSLQHRSSYVLIAHDSDRSMDTLTREARGERMSRVRGKDTKPELLIRGLIHGMKYRYRLHRRDLPGSPDIVFPSRPKVIGSEEHTSELQSLMRTSYAVCCLK